MAASVVEHLRAQSEATLARMYTEPTTCLAVVRVGVASRTEGRCRLLPKLAQIVVFRTLYLEDPIPVAAVRDWLQPAHQGLLEETLDLLLSLRILARVDRGRPEGGGGSAIVLVTAFRQNLRAAITAQPVHSSFDVTVVAVTGTDAAPTVTDAAPTVTVDALDQAAKARWEAVLHYMLRIDQEARPSSDVIRLLERAHLIGSKAERRDRTTRLTAEGFQFLLQGAAAQLWTLLRQYMGGPGDGGETDDAGVDRSEVLNLLFLLGTLRFGTAYELASASADRKQVLTLFADLGIIYQTKAGSRRFWPTRLALTLTSANTAAAETHMEGFIVLETNFDLYAYTDSPLQIAILNLFTTLEYRFPNMVKGVLRRESLRRAYDAGITAEQILHYLHIHAHPQLRKRSPTIPATVSDQIRLWQMERDRLVVRPGVLYRDLASDDEFQQLANYARDLGVLLYQSAVGGTAGVVIVTAAGSDQVRRFYVQRFGPNAASRPPAA